MFVSVEVITMLACAVSIIVAFVSGCGWLINRMDVRFDRMDARIDERFAIQDARIDEKFAAQDARIDERFARIDERFERIDERFERIDERFLGVGHELGEIRIAIARLEGPPRRLIGLR
ncbi:response regulator [Microbacterium sp. NPDC087591]|uniref:response regulator n=1 Tax=Microbacterium sp. NPDC087591 TaxID=3364192 RepID=UPI00382BE159